MGIVPCPRCFVNAYSLDDDKCYYCGCEGANTLLRSGYRAIIPRGRGKSRPCYIHEVEIPEEDFCESCQIPLQNEQNQKTEENSNGECEEM